MAKDKDKPVPSDIPQVQEFRNVTEGPGEPATPLSVTVVESPLGPESLYWFGALPWIGKKKVRFPHVDYSYELEDFAKEETMTALEAWEGRYSGGVATWLGRYEYLQNLDCNGFSFPAFTQEVFSERMNEGNTARYTWPGGIAALTESRVKEILDSVQDFAFRRKISEVLANGQPAPKNYMSFLTIDYKRGHMDGCVGGKNTIGYKGMACPKCVAIDGAIPPNADPFTRRNPRIDYEWRQAGDLPLADYVYFMKLPAPATTPIVHYPRLVKSMTQFLLDPPPPLSGRIVPAVSAA